ncbi:MAG: sulfurtransferase [Deltaproteobacteria bacterium]|jgi:rhodanese-related sulfurtransferase|nr:sulfurtransferase [Deltaproteobacteria bacterium]
MQIKKITAISLALSLALVLGLGYATTTLASDTAQTDKPADWKFHSIVDVEFVMEQVKVPMPEDVMIIDARPKRAKYDKGHIPMAVSIPDSQFDKMSDQLPADKNALLIFYCGGLKCKLSHKSAKKAEKLGYTNVKVFADGFPGYMKVAANYAAVSADWVKKQIEKKTDIVLIDSRPKRKKYDKGHIPTAISIPDSKFAKMQDQLPADKNTPLVFYCGGLKCRLSHKSAKKAIDLGYTKVKVFAEGYPFWVAAYGKGDTAAVASAKPTAATQLKTGKEEGSVDTETFIKMVKNNPEKIMLIDVRDADEFKTGSFKNAINIPVDELEDKIKTLPTDKPIVFVCGTGARSGESFYMVQDLRPEIKNVYYLEGELTFKKDGTFEVKEPVS